MNECLTGAPWCRRADSCLLPFTTPKYFGEAPVPKLDFLRLKSPPPRVKQADINDIAKYDVGENIVLNANPSKGVKGLRSGQIKAVEFANPNYPPFPRSDEPEPVYLVELDSTETTLARNSPRWVREERVMVRPAGTQYDAWQKATEKWDRVWEENRDFKQLAEKNTRKQIEETLEQASQKLLKSLSAAELYQLPISRIAHSKAAEEFGLRPALQRSSSTVNSNGRLSTALRYGRMRHFTRQLSPLREPRSPPQRHRPNCPRQVRVRNKIAQPTENPATRVDNRRRSPWYAASGSPPPRRNLLPTLDYERIVVHRR